MDWKRSRDVARSRSVPDLELLETCWRVVGPSNRVFECGIYQLPIGLEVRAGYGADDLIRSQFAASIEPARDIAEEWRQAVLEKGFTELKPKAREKWLSPRAASVLSAWFAR